MNNKKCYGPFQLWVLNNFPFTIDDWDSVTQYQMLCKCLGALKEQLDVNSDLYQKISDLDNYIKNLDLQDEVNNKIDEMAESGELQEIITEYLQINGVLAFNTVSNMISATNIIDGSICRTLGLNTYNDGKGEFYKIRTITSEDIVDGINIIALNISNTLIAEKIPNYFINNLQNQINEITKLKHIIIIGDSYAAGSTNVGGVTSNVTPYTEYARQFINYPTTHFHTFGSNGAGFTHLGSGGYTFLTSLKTFDNTLASVANDVSEIYVFGGINDRDSSISDILNAIKDFVDYAKLKYPNSKVYVGELGRLNGLTNEGEHYKIQQTVIPAYSQCQQVGAINLSGTENIMQINSLFSDDNIHPSENGYIVVGKYIGQTLLNKYCIVTKETTDIEVTRNSSINFSTFEVPLTEKIDNKEIFIYSGQINLNISGGTSWNTANLFKIGSYTLPYGNVSVGTGISEDVILTLHDNTLNKTFVINGKLIFQRNGDLTIYAPILDSTGSSFITFNNINAISMKLQYQTKQINCNLL